MKELAIIIGVIVLVCVFLSLFGWAAAALVSFIFGINFGFWKGVALVVLCGILFGGRSGGKSE